MAYRLIRGEFHLFYQGPARRSGSQPDGDSCWFKPSSARAFDGVDTEDPDRRVEFNAGGMVQLRFEAIDALEVHFQGRHQEMALAKKARDLTLENAGFRSVDFSGASLTTAKTAVPHPIPGHVLTRKIDPNQRPVCFVFAGRAREADRSDVFLDVPRVRRSLNSMLIAAGHAYPSFYTGLPRDLREHFAAATRRARRKGLWPKDASRKGFAVPSVDALDRSVIWPKLFRRLVEFKRSGRPISSFDAWLREKPTRDDSLWILSRGELANLHDVVEIRRGKIRMRFDPGDLIIVPR